MVEKGIDSISVNADMAEEIGEYIEELEKELVATSKQIDEGDLDNVVNWYF